MTLIKTELRHGSVFQTGDRDGVAKEFRAVRRTSTRLQEPVGPEDCCIQSMPEVSPMKWHLAHTSWFFETFVLQPATTGYRSSDPQFDFLFNSYYNAVGEQYARPDRGLLSRPTLAEVMDYRARIDEAVEGVIASKGTEWLERIELGLHHEQQHQELMLMDIKHVFSRNPLRPAYCRRPEPQNADVAPIRWLTFDGGLESVGHRGEGFAFDNESPRHRTFIESFQMADRLVTCGEYLEFIEDGGYERPELWLSDGWSTVSSRGWRAPLYWEQDGNTWRQMTLTGMRDVNPSEPVCHVSFYEADAFARWKECWLPREEAWEVVAREEEMEGNLLEADRLHPMALNASPSTQAPAKQAPAKQAPAQLFGDVWEWTSSPYSAYPGYRPTEGALGEYNGKFMCNQMVLRGGSCATPASHLRPTYRNFFPPDARWVFAGIRLTKES